MKKTTISAIALSLALVLAGCGDDDGGGGIAETGDAETSSSTAADSTSSTTAAADATISLDSTSLGDVIVDAEGMTLYAFTPDSADASTCNDACADTWPPVADDGDVTVGEGLDEDLLSTITRADGSKQLAYGDHPLYLFSGDQSAGQTNGQGVGDRWFVVDAEGELIQG